MSQKKKDPQDARYFLFESEFFERPRYITDIDTRPMLNLSLTKPHKPKAEYCIVSTKSVTKELLKAESDPIDTASDAASLEETNLMEMDILEDDPSISISKSDDSFDEKV